MTNQDQSSHSITKVESTGLAEGGQTHAWTDPEWQRLWLRLDSMPWRTLALLPAGDGGPADFTLTLAVALSRTGMSHVGAPILVADGSQVPLNQLNAFLADVRACRDGGERVIIALSAATENPTTISLAQQADGVVLCVLLGRMRTSHAKRAVNLIGASKFFGSVIIHPDGSIAPPAPK